MTRAAELVDHLSIIPSHLFDDLGPAPTKGQRFHHHQSLLTMVAAMADGRSINAHSSGLALPGDSHLDGELLEAIITVGDRLGGFTWLSDHLTVMASGHAGELASDRVKPLPVSYNQECFSLLAVKLGLLTSRLGCPILLENPATLTPSPAMGMEEPEFLNGLVREGHCAVLLDLHNLLVSARNGGLDCESYFAALDPQAVMEVHLASGETANRMDSDSHSKLTSEDIWHLGTPEKARSTAAQLVSAIETR
jgi:uncharacterized protein (UPF0276 family)